MSARARELAERFERANDEVIAAVERCSDEQWQAICRDEQWPVVVTARHIAGAHAFIGEQVRRIANGEPLPPIEMEMIDRENALDVERFKDCTRAEVLALLRSNGEKAASMVRALTDEQLQRTDASAGMSADTLIETGLIGHVIGHGKSVKAAIGAP